MDFDFNRRLRRLSHRQPEGRGLARLGHHAAGRRLRTLSDKDKCDPRKRPEGGYVLIRLGNDESLGRELRTYLQTEKYLTRKNDGTLPNRPNAFLRDCAEDNRHAAGAADGRCSAEMLAEAEYFVAGTAL